MSYRVGSVKKNLKPFKAWLHYGDASNLPMHTVSFHGNQYDLNVLIKMAEAEGEPLRVQKVPSRRTVTKRKRSYAKRTSGPRKGTTRRSGPRRNSIKDMVLAAYVEGFSTPAGIAGYIHKKYDKRVDIDDIARVMTANI